MPPVRGELLFLKELVFGWIVELDSQEQPFDWAALALDNPL
jgi:hypothetical protein